MGRLFSFQCPKCAYTVDCSGKADAGMMSATRTVVCDQCRNLQDVVVETYEMGRNRKRVPPRCEKDKTHNVRTWKHPGPCPRCGETLVRGEPVVLWD